MTVKHLVVVPHTHWDREWYAPFESFRKRLVAAIDHLIEIMERDRTFSYFELDGQTIVLSDYLEIRPENESRLRRLIERGRIRIGPWYVQPDEFLVSGESIIRNLRFGIKQARQFGEPSMIGYMPDQFGHIAQMPQIFAGLGVRAAVVWRGVGDTVTRTQFLWEALDGTRLFSVYLADSYNSGEYLPLKPAALRDRLSTLIENQKGFCDIDTLLVMNGVDHMEPQKGLPAQLKKTVGRMPGVTFEMGNLDIFIARARNEARDLIVHHGEFRSTRRAPLIPGVTSARVRQKQRDFANCRLLERYVEPLATWASLCGDERPHGSFIDYAWRLTIENHPHDSICGCSVNEVHDEMETRFDKVEQVAKALRDDSLSFMAGLMDTSWVDADTPALCIYTPTGLAQQLVDVVVDLEEPAFVNALADCHGKLVAVQKIVGERETFIQAQAPPEMIAEQVAGMEGRDLLGYFINNILWRRDGSTLRLVIVMARAPIGEVDVEKRKRELLEELRDPSLEMVDISGVSGAQTRMIFSVDDLAPHGLSVLAGVRELIEDTAEQSLNVSTTALENDFYCVSVNADGTLDIADKKTGSEFRRCLRFVDEGDRGDSYTFDEVPGDEAIDSPAGSPQVSVIETGPVRATIKIDVCLHIPEKLVLERDARSSNRVATSISTLVSVYKDIKRIDFTTTFDNQCEDHRLRVVFNAPIETPEIITETVFGVVRRSSRTTPLEDCAEQPIGTGPQKTFSCIENGSIGATLFNRGIPEIEAIAGDAETALALTLVRAFGWLSRDDLKARPDAAGPALETSGGQSKGVHVFEYAFTSYRGTYAEANVAAQAHSYAYPPVATVTNRHRGKIKGGSSLVDLDNPNVIVSAVERSRLKHAWTVRLYNTTESTQSTRLTLWGRRTTVYEVNLLEKRLSRDPLRRRNGKLELSFRPGEIKTLQVVFPK